MLANKRLTALIVIVGLFAVAFLAKDAFKQKTSSAIDSRIPSIDNSYISQQYEAIEIKEPSLEEDIKTESQKDSEQIILDRSTIEVIANQKSTQASKGLAGYELLLTAKKSDNGALKITAGNAYRLAYTSEEKPIALALDYPGMIEGGDKSKVFLLGENGVYQQLDTTAHKDHLQTQITLNESMQGKFFIHVDRSVQFPLSPNRYLLLVE